MSLVFYRGVAGHSSMSGLDDSFVDSVNILSISGYRYKMSKNFYSPNFINGHCRI